MLEKIVYCKIYTVKYLLDGPLDNTFEKSVFVHTT